MNGTILGYRRSNGQVGFRNHVAVLAAMDNINGVVKKISDAVRGTLPLPIWYGRGQFGQDEELTFRTLVGMGQNPNLAAVLVVSLEPVSARKLAEAIAESGKPVRWVSVQTAGNSIAAVAEGTMLAAELVKEVSEYRREPVGLDELVLGVECGGSDTTSGIAGNPSLGYVADRVVEAGGTVVLSETSEIMGAEHILARRARSPQVAEAIYAAVRRIEEEANARGVSILGANPVPDNIAGGLTTIEEKSLGAIIKAGTAPVEGVIGFAERPQGKGLYVMDTPAPAAESMTGLAAGGVQLILFATGKGNSVGSPLAPTIKVSGNPETVRRMAPNIDYDVSDLFLGEKNLDEVGSGLYDYVLKTLSGKMTASEILQEEQIALNRIQPTV